MTKPATPVGCLSLTKSLLTRAWVCISLKESLLLRFQWRRPFDTIQRTLSQLSPFTSKDLGFPLLSGVLLPEAASATMSAILSADDLNDFISPGVACIKPVESLPQKNTKDSEVSRAFLLLNDRGPSFADFNDRILTK